MPHTPICPPPPRTSPYFSPRRSRRPFFRNPFHPRPIVCRDTPARSLSLPPSLPPSPPSLCLSQHRSPFDVNIFSFCMILPCSPLSLFLFLQAGACGRWSDCGRVKGAIFLGADPLHYFNERSASIPSVFVHRLRLATRHSALEADVIEAPS